MANCKNLLELTGTCCMDDPDDLPCHLTTLGKYFRSRPAYSLDVRLRSVSVPDQTTHWGVGSWNET